MVPGLAVIAGLSARLSCLGDSPALSSWQVTSKQPLSLWQKRSFSWRPHFILPAAAIKEVGKGEPCVTAVGFAFPWAAPVQQRDVCWWSLHRSVNALVSSLDPTYAALACLVMLLLHSLSHPPPPPGRVKGSTWVVYSQVLVAAGLF